MADSLTGAILAEHVAALVVETQSGTGTLDALSRIEQKLDAAFRASTSPAPALLPESNAGTSLQFVATPAEPRRPIVGMCRHTGRKISGVNHLRQSIEIILTTALTSRVMRPAVGSELPSLRDLPLNRWGIAALQAAAIDALRQEPRIKTIHSVQAVEVTAGSVAFEMDLEFDLDGVLTRSTLQAQA